MNFCIVGYLRILNHPKQCHLAYKNYFLEAINFSRLSIGAIVLFDSKFLPLRALETEKIKLRGRQTGAYILV